MRKGHALEGLVCSSVIFAAGACFQGPSPGKEVRPAAVSGSLVHVESHDDTSVRGNVFQDVSLKVSNLPDGSEAPGVFDLEETRNLFITVSFMKPIQSLGLKVEVISPDGQVYDTFEKLFPANRADADRVERGGGPGVKPGRPAVKGQPASIMEYGSMMQVTWRLPVWGTVVRSMGMTGTWRVRAFLGQERKPSAELVFELKRS